MEGTAPEPLAPTAERSLPADLFHFRGTVPNALAESPHAAKAVPPNRSRYDSSACNAPALLAIPPESPRFVALVGADDGADLDRAVFLIGKRLWYDDRLEMAEAISEAAGAASLILDEHTQEAVFVSRAAFQKLGVTGAFLGLSCLNESADDVVKELIRQARGAPGLTLGDRKKRRRLGELSLFCLDSRPETAGINRAQLRFSLTAQERNEAESIIAGLSCKESASRLGLSPETVRQRRKIIYRKLGVTTSGQATARIMGIEPLMPVRPAAPRLRRPVLMRRRLAIQNDPAGSHETSAAQPQLQAAS